MTRLGYKCCTRRTILRLYLYSYVYTYTCTRRSFQERDVAEQYKIKQISKMDILYSWYSRKKQENNEVGQLSCNSCSRLTKPWKLRKLSYTNTRLSTLINSHATLVLVSTGHESWENSHLACQFPSCFNPRLK